MPSDIGHEGDGIRTGWVMVTALGIAVLVPLLMLCVWFNYRIMANARWNGLTFPTMRAPKNYPSLTYPPPQLQHASGEQLKAFRAEQEEELNSYGWVDQAHGTVHIPIERAMDLLAEGGLPVRGSNVDSIGPSEYQLTIERRLDSNQAPIKEIKLR